MEEAKQCKACQKYFFPIDKFFTFRKDSNKFRNNCKKCRCEIESKKWRDR